MPTTRRKRKAIRRDTPGMLSREQLLYLWSGYNLLDGQEAHADAKDWAKHREHALREYRATWPCTRPWAWWQFERATKTQTHAQNRKRLWSPDFLVEIDEPEYCYLKRRALLARDEELATRMQGYLCVVEQEAEYWQRCLAHARGKSVTPRPVSRYVWQARERNSALYANPQTVAGLAWFDEDAAQHAVKFIHLHLRHSKGEWAGKPFRISPWQEHDIVRQVFGWKLLPDGMTAEQAAAIQHDRRLDAGVVRLYRFSYIEVCRKNGKSTLMAAVAHLLANGDREAGAEVYIAATKKDQARIIHDEAVRMRAKSPDLSACTVHRRSEHQIENPLTNSTIKPLGADSDTLDGLNPHGNICDELHQHRTEQVLDKLTTGEGSRRQSLTATTTTAGAGRKGVCWRERTYGAKILEGHPDPRYHVYIACVDEETKWEDLNELIKANPNLGISVKQTYLDARIRKAKESPTDMGIMLRMHCGVWTQTHSYWVPMQKWDACAGNVNPKQWRNEAIERLRGKTCGAGLDLGSTADLTSLVLAFDDEDDEGRGVTTILPWFWCPEERATERSRIDRAPYTDAIRDGFLTATPGDETDYDHVEADILAISEMFAIGELNGDPLFQGSQLFQRLTRHGINVVDFPQTIVHFAAPTKHLEELVMGERLRHGGNPLLRWMATNVVVIRDGNNNMRPHKAKSTERIDGIVATIMSLRAKDAAAQIPDASSWAFSLG